MTRSLPFDIQPQPDDTTCGPTCLHAVYDYFGDAVPLEDVLHSVPTLETGGTLGVHLANHALARGYRATIVTWNLQVFDPTWFRPGAPPLAERLARQAELRDEPRIRSASRAYLTFVERGGRLTFEDLEPGLLRRPLELGLPVITGLSATFLYRESRERATDHVPDDILGEPCGHFVVLTGYVRARREVYVSDPLHPNSLSEAHTYRVPVQRVLGAIYLGALTHDANLVILEPGRSGPGDACRP